jgi:hypothetical protein
VTRKFARPPISEVHRSQLYRYDAALFAQSSPYFEALDAATKIVRLNHQSTTEAERHKLKILLVHECEQSKTWARSWDAKDDPQRAIDEWHSLSKPALRSLASSLAALRRVGERHACDLRNTLHRSAQFAMSPNEANEAWLPNVNLENNGFFFPTGGPIAQQVELQLLNRLFLGGFPEWLAKLDAEISELHARFELGRRLGPMWIDPPLSRRQVLCRDGEQNGTLALIARLQGIMRRVTRDGNYAIPISPDAICGEIPTFGFPCWAVISAFVQATFEGAPDMRVLQQRWSAFQKNRSIRLSGWPASVQRQGLAAIE